MSSARRELLSRADFECSELENRRFALNRELHPEHVVAICCTQSAARLLRVYKSLRSAVVACRAMCEGATHCRACLNRMGNHAPSVTSVPRRLLSIGI